MNVGKNSLKIPRCNQKMYIENGQTMTMAKIKRTDNNNGHKKKDKGINKTLHRKTKDPATRTPLNTGCELRYSGRVSISKSICEIRRVTLATNQVINKMLFTNIRRINHTAMINNT